jgi:hypothetical protein
MVVRHKRCFLIVFSTLTALGVAQSSSGPELRSETSKQASAHKPVDGHLVRVQTTTAPAELASEFYRPFRCDSDGNLYVRTDSGGLPAVHKLNSKGERLALFDAL